MIAASRKHTVGSGSKKHSAPKSKAPSKPKQNPEKRPTKRKAPRTLIDVRMEEAQAALQSFEEEERENEEKTMLRATWRSRDKWERVKSPVAGPGPLVQKKLADSAEQEVAFEEEVIPQVRRPFCMMRAGTRGGFSIHP